MKRFLQILMLVSGSLTALHAAAADWRVMQSDSRIGFVATYDTIPFDAWFRSFDARIRFAPGELDDASFDVRIDLSSVDSNSRDRDQGMKRPTWFAVDRYPEARFQSERFEKLSEDRFKAIGTLSLKGITRTIDIPFTWEQSGNDAALTVETELTRGDFNIGTGEWAEDDIIGFTVEVRAELQLKRR